MRVSLLGFVAIVAGCTYGGASGFGDGEGSSGGAGSAGGLGGSGGGSGSSGSAGRLPGQPEPATCDDGKKNGAEGDVDCGGACDKKCDDGAACAQSSDCANAACKGDVCQPPSSTDGVKNGDESDVDCGGKSTGAPGCAVGKLCNVHADCGSNGCKADHTCVDAPSCLAHFGGDTCGHGEVGSGEEQHESCCTTVAFPGFTDAGHPGQQVFVDRYEITAGRVREWIRRLGEEYGGEPNVKQWIQEHEPAGWDASWNQYLPHDLESNDGVYSEFSAFGEDDQGFHIHGMNCNQGDGSYGSSTYWLPDDVIAEYAGGKHRAFTQDEMDVKAMTCITHVMAAAFCAWDGGQLVTTSALKALTGNGQSLPHQESGTIEIYRDGGNGFGEPLAHEWPFGGGDDGAGRVTAGGRVDADVFDGPGGGRWFDLAGNANEMTRNDSPYDPGYGLQNGPFRLANDEPVAAPIDPNLTPTSRLLGIGYGSVMVQLQDQNIDNPNVSQNPNYKSGLTGARCMRFQ